MAAGYSVQISAVDKATATLNKVNKALADTLAPINRMSGALAKLGDTSGINRLGSGLANLERQAVRTAEGMARIVPALGAITGAASLAGLARLASQWADFGQKLGFTATRIGISTQQLQGLQGAARLAGSSSEAMTGSLRGLQQTMQDAVGGRNNDAVAMFQRLGISFKGVGYNARSVTEVLPELADKIAGIENPQLQAMIATQLFGGAAEDLLPLLRQGSAGIRRLTDESVRYGTLSEDGAAKAREFAAAQTRISLAVEGLGLKIGERLVPVLIPLLDRFSGWVQANSPAIIAFFDRAATALTRWVDSGGVQDMIAKMEAFGTKVNTVVQAFGGWEVAATGLGVVLGAKLLSPLTGIVTAMGVLGGIKPSPWMLKMMGVAGPLGIAMDLAGGKTADDQHTTNTESLIAQLGKSLGERLGMSFDGAGNSEGLLSRWFGGGRDTGSGAAGMTPGEAARGGRPQLGAGSARLASAEQMRRAQEAQNYFVGKGWSPQQAAGIVANLHQESGFNAGAVGDSGTAYGIAQWHGDRRDAIARLTGKSIVGSSFQDQLEAVHLELTKGQEQAAGRALRQAGTASEAGAIVSRLYERPAARDAEAANRGASAEGFMRRFSAAAPAGSAPNGVPAIGPTFGPPMPGPAAPGIQQAAPAVAGRVAVDVTHRGDPGNTNVRVTTSGDAEPDRLRVERAPLLMGIP